MISTIEEKDGGRMVDPRKPEAEAEERGISGEYVVWE